jgi:hypothetical protein
MHIFTHPDGGQMLVCLRCSRGICPGYSPEQEEQRLRRLKALRSRWLTRLWGTSWNGNETVTIQCQGVFFEVTIFKSRFGGGWAFCISVAGRKVYSPEPLSSAQAAKEAAFDLLECTPSWMWKNQDAEET